jgi:hypothetical protein
MSKSKEPDFSERLNAAAKARKDVLERFRAKTDPNDPAIAQREEARRAIAAGREVRAAERRIAKLAEEARLAEEKAAKAAALAAEKVAQAAALEAEKRAQEAALAEKAAREAELEIERKAKRDARYAARKTRGKKKK